MKRLKKKTLAAAALVVAGAVYYFTGGNDSADAPEPQQEPSEVSRATGKSSSGKHSATVAAGLEIPASTGSGRIVRHGAYVSSYNTSTLIPDWVAYELTAEEAGGRRDREGIEFRMDPDLKGCTQAMREDYSGSGWTKGHLMPAADAATSSSTMAETFYFTNICPQDETLNAGDWQFLEK